MRWHGWVIAGIVAISGLVAGCWSDMLDSQYIYFPERWESRDWRGLSGMPLEDVWVTAQDGTRVFSWYVEAPTRKAVLLWCHGNAGNITHRLDNLRELYRRGISVLLLDYRGYGQSEGQPSEEGLYADALAAYDYLVTTREIPPEQVILFGRSLGASVIGEVARLRKAAGLILESPFPSVESVAKSVFGGLPAHMLVKARFDLTSRLRKVHMPVLVLHGDRDTVIPYELGQAVFAAANEPKRFWRIPGADHNDTYVVGGEAYFQELLRFIGEQVR